MEGNYPGVIIREAIIQAPIVRGQFFWRPLSGVQLSGGQLSCEAIVQGAIIRGAIVLEPRKIYYPFKWIQLIE